MHGYCCFCPTCHDLLVAARAESATPEAHAAWDTLMQIGAHAQARQAAEKARDKAALAKWMAKYIRPEHLDAYLAKRGDASMPTYTGHKPRTGHEGGE